MVRPRTYVTKTTGPNRRPGSKKQKDVFMAQSNLAVKEDFASLLEESYITSPTTEVTSSAPPSIHVSFT